MKQSKSNRIGSWFLRTLRLESADGIGSGFLLNTKDQIATCSHIVRSSKTGHMTGLIEGTFEVLAKDDENDVAILRADFGKKTKGMKKLFGRIDSIKLRQTDISIGASITVCGYPAIGWQVGSPFLISGLVSFKKPKGPGLEAIEDKIVVSCLIHHGNSGGPCFDQKGRLVGLVKELNNLGTVEAWRRGENDKAKRPFDLDIPTGYGLLVPASYLLDLAGSSNLEVGFRT